MCRPASFVVTKQRIFWSKDSDSHENIISEFGLYEGAAPQVNFVRIEIVPGDGDLASPIDSWMFKLDQDIRPDWYDAKEVEARARKELMAWADAKLLRGTHEVRSGEAYALSGSVVKAYDSSVVTAYGSSTVTAYGSSTVTAYGSSVVKAYGSSVVTACDSSVVTAYDSSVVTAYDSSVVTACDSSVVKACGSSVVTAYGSSVVTACENQATVCLYNHQPKAVVPSGPFAVVIDRTGEKAICTIG